MSVKYSKHLILTSLALLFLLAFLSSAIVSASLSPESVIKRDVTTQNNHDWLGFLSIRTTKPGPPENRNDWIKIREINPDADIMKNIVTAQLGGIKKLPLSLSARLTRIDWYLDLYNEVRTYYVAIDYRLQNENRSFYNGVNYRFYVLALEEGQWVIVEASEVPVHRIVEAGLGFGTTEEKTALRIQKKRERTGKFINPKGKVLAETARLAVTGDHQRPSTIKVYRVQLAYIDEVNFYEYVKNVLPNEWYGSWPIESLRAGALASKMYGWYRVYYAKYPGKGYDVKDDAHDQVYKPGSDYWKANNAVDDVNGIGVDRADGMLFETQYCAGDYGPDKPSGWLAGRMSQWGTKYWADQGKDYSFMVHYYWDNSPQAGGQLAHFFNYGDTPPTVNAFSVTPDEVPLGNSFTISYTVSDDIGLKQTELWRANDSNGTPVSWAEIEPQRTSLSGQTSYSGSFTDTPSSTGTYWYGMHVVDTAGQWSVEPDPPGPIQVTVTSEPQLSVSPTSLNFGTTQTQKTFNISNSGGGPLSWNVSKNKSWISVSPTSGTNSGTVTVNVNRSGLSDGNYNGTVSVTSNGGNKNVSISIQVEPQISVTPTSLTNSCQEGNNASSQSFEVWNSGDGTLSYSISDNATWLSCSPISGTSTGEQDTITVNYSTSGLSDGNYSAEITISDPNASNSPQTIQVNLTVIPEPEPTICLNPTSLSPSCEEGEDASSQNFQVWNCGDGTLSYSISDNATWLSCSPISGTSTGEQDTITVNYSTSGLSDGNYSATITISDHNASNSSQRIQVSLTVNYDHAVTVEINLGEDWNLVSFNVESSDSSIVAVLSSIDGLYSYVSGYKSSIEEGGPKWVTYDPDRPFNDLKQLDRYHGYWIKMESAGIIEITGSPGPVDTPIELGQNWNLVSYIPNQSGAMPDILNSINGLYSYVSGYKSSIEEGGPKWVTYDPDRPFNDLKQLDPYHGYWIKMDSAGTLTYPTSVPQPQALLVTVPSAPSQDKSVLGNEFISGIVSDGTSGIEGATVQAWQNDVKIKETTTVSSGSYELSGLEAGSYYLRAYKHDYYAKIIENQTAPQSDVEIVLESLPSIAVPGQINPCDFWSQNTTISSSLPIQIGDVVTAKEPDGVICGVTTVGDAGTGEGDYFIHVYGDDPNTPSDEGAEDGDTITFFINKEYETEQKGTWTSGSSIELDLHAPDYSLPVTLSAFYATMMEDKVVVEWQTQTEQSNLGWDIYRSSKKDGEYTKVNATKIAGAGTSTEPHTYQFVDENVEASNTYFYYLENIDFEGRRHKSHLIQVKMLTTLGKIKYSALYPNFPNPFNPDTWIPFQLSSDSPVVIDIYDINGKLVRKLDLGVKKAGYYLDKLSAAHWDGRSQTGERVASGIYLYTIKAGKFTATRRMVVVK